MSWNARMLTAMCVFTAMWVVAVVIRSEILFALGAGGALAFGAIWRFRDG